MSADAISFDDFVRVDLRIGTVISAEPNVHAHKPAYVLRIDLGRLGLRVSSAQITELYEPSELVGRQVLCVCNLASKRIAGVTSEVLVLGAYDFGERVVLAGFEYAVPNGTRLR